MLNNLTSAFLAKMADSFREPIQLVVFRFPSVGNVYVSDRDIVVNNQLYKGIVENWGELTTSGEGDSISGTTEISITLWNGSENRFSDYFLSDDPMNVFVDLYQTFEGLDPEDMATIGTYIIQDPIEYAEADRLLTIDLVTTNMRYFAEVGSLLTTNEFPLALESDVNKSIDLIIGDCGNVQALCSQSPLTTTQSGSILKRPTKVYSQDNLDDLGFPASGLIQIDSEIMAYSSRTEDYFDVVTRGYNSTVSVHSDSTQIIQAGIDIEYIVGQGPISEIKNVLVKGQTPTVDYTVHPDENPAVIRFKKQPTYVEYSKGARSTELDFDATNADNTAYQPHYAYNSSLKSYGAVINRSNRKLSILQYDPAEDDGEVVKVFLCVEHWATATYNVDRVDVNVEGISGALGSLSRPNIADIVTIDADVDIDHPHAHVSGGTHEHGFANPSLGTTNPAHLHQSSLSGPEVSDGSSTGLPYTMYNGSSTGIKTKTFYYSYVSSAASKKLHVAFKNISMKYVKIETGLATVTWYGSKTVDQYLNVSPTKTSIRVTIGGYEAVGASVKFTTMELTTTKTSGISATSTAVNAVHLSTGDVGYQGIDTSSKLLKDKYDVGSLSTTNRKLENIATTSSSKKVVDKFDVTDKLETVSWNWLQNRKISVEYVGSANTADVVLTWVYFEVEYRQKQTKTTNEVSAYVVGSLENRPDAVIQYLLTEKAGLPTDKIGSVWRSVPVWVDSELWEDLELWEDEGQVSGVPSGALFKEAGAWFNFHGYLLDCALSGSLTVKDAIQKITHQTRSSLKWQNGKAKLIVMREKEEWTIAKDIIPSSVQLSSIRATKTVATEIVNKIDLFYDLDRLSTITGPGAYNKTASRTDETSISNNGVRRNDDNFSFDLIRDEQTAEQTAEYYIWLSGETRTVYNFKTYLNNFDIEKGDYITLTSTGFDALNRLPLVVRDYAREFGSGKDQRINLLSLYGESIRHKKFLLFEEDEAIVSDFLELVLGSEFYFNDPVAVNDILSLWFKIPKSEAVTITDSLVSVLYYGSQPKETLLFRDTLSAKIEISVENEIVIKDDFTIAQELCFGACGFGCPDGVGPVFGSKTTHRGFSDEYQGVTDILESFINTDIKDNVDVSDELVFSDGFGCPSGNGSGFGLSPFGEVNCNR